MKKQSNQQQTPIQSFTAALWIAAVGLILASTMVSAPPAFAQHVTGGALNIIDDSAANFTLTGTPIFTVQGNTYVPGGNMNVFCDPCYSPIVPFFGASGLDLGQGNGIVGVTPTSFVYPVLIWSSLLINNGPSYFMITGPPIPINGPGSYSGPISYQLALCGVCAPEQK